MAKKPEAAPPVYLTGWAPYALIALAGLAVYARTLFFGFVYLDDNALILDRFPFIGNLANLAEAFRRDVFHSPAGAAAYYRPLLTVSFMIDAQIGGASPWIYHATNVLLHMLASCLIFRALRGMGRPAATAFFLSLLFAVHPVNTQAVAWIGGRNDTLVTVFVLSSLIFLLDYWEERGPGRLAGHLIFLALALLTKESSVALPPLCLIYRSLAGRERPLPRPIPWVGWAAALGIWVVLRHFALKNAMPMTASFLAQSVLNNLPAAVQFVGKLVLPFNLSVLPIIQDTTYIYGLASLALIGGALLLSKEMRGRWIVFGLSWFVLFLLPSFVRPNPDVVADFIEHRLYLPFFGFLLILGEIDWIKNSALKEGRLPAWALALALAAAALGARHARHFQDRFSFWRNAAEHSPHSPLARRNYGAMLYLDGRLDEAEGEYRASAALNSAEPMVHNNLGLIFMQKGLLPQAEREFLQELAINPNYDNAHFNLGLLYYRVGRKREAEALWKRTLAINPDYAGAYHNLIALAAERNDRNEAAAYAEAMRRRGIPPPESGR